MANPRSFGRKGQLRGQSRPQRPMRPVPATAPRADFPAQIEPEPVSASSRLAPSVADEELEAWKQTRKRQIPWGPLSLMASLCFGIASFELPDSVNGMANLLLYALSAISLWVWFSNRREKKRAKAQNLARQ